VIDVNVSELVVHVVMVSCINEPSVRANPTSPIPTVVIGTAAVPVPVAVQPRANRKTGTERDQTAGVVARVISP
jgi:hypothetical protein